MCILRRGEVVVEGALRELLDTGAHWSEVTLTEVTAELRESILALGVKAHDMAGAFIVDVAPCEAAVHPDLRIVLAIPGGRQAFGVS